MRRWFMFRSCRSGSLCHCCCCTWSHVNHHMYLSMHLSFLYQRYSDYRRWLRAILLLRCSTHLLSQYICSQTMTFNHCHWTSQWPSICDVSMRIWPQCHLLSGNQPYSQAQMLPSRPTSCAKSVACQLPICNVWWQTHETMTPALVTDIEHVFARCRSCLSQQKANTSWRTTTMSENHGRRLWMDCRRVPRIHQFKPRGLSWLCETIAECLVPTNEWWQVITPLAKANRMLRRGAAWWSVDDTLFLWVWSWVSVESCTVQACHPVLWASMRHFERSTERSALIAWKNVSALPRRSSTCIWRLWDAWCNTRASVGRWKCDAVRRRAHDQMPICGEAAALLPSGARLDRFRNVLLETVAIIFQRTTVQNVKTWCSEGWPHVWVFLLRFPKFRPTRAIFLGDVSPAVELALYWLQLSPLVRRCICDVVQFCWALVIHV